MKRELEMLDFFGFPPAVCLEIDNPNIAVPNRRIVAATVDRYYLLFRRRNFFDH